MEIIFGHRHYPTIGIFGNGGHLGRHQSRLRPPSHVAVSLCQGAVKNVRLASIELERSTGQSLAASSNMSRRCLTCTGHHQLNAGRYELGLYVRHVVV